MNLAFRESSDRGPEEKGKGLEPLLCEASDTLEP